MRGDETLVTDGPFVETKDVVGGFTLIDCADLRRGDRHRRPAPVRALRDHRGPTGLGAVTDEVEAAVAAAFRDEWTQVVATLIRQTGDWDLAEDCAQEAFATALDRWRRDGIPTRPGAWLTTTARNRATDHLRRQAVGRDKLAEVAALVAADGTPGDAYDVQDDRLRLIFTCCHPALDFDSSGRPDAACRRRADHARDRPCVPHC